MRGLIRFAIDNGRGIVSLVATPNGKPVRLRGANGTGKSSAIDMLWWGVGGRLDGDVVRNGADCVRTEIELDDYRVVRQMKRGGRPTLVVKDSTGRTLPEPTALLAGFAAAIGRRTFSAMTDEEQVAVLLKLAPQLDVSDLRAKASAIQADRVAVGRERDTLRGHLAGLPETTAPAAPPAEIPLEVFTDRRREVREVLAEKRQLEKGAESEQVWLDNCRAKEAEVSAAIGRVAYEAKRLQASFVAIMARRTEVLRAGHDLELASGRVRLLEAELAAARDVETLARNAHHRAIAATALDPEGSEEEAIARAQADHDSLVKRCEQLQEYARIAEGKLSQLRLSAAALECTDADLDAIDDEEASAKRHNDQAREAARQCAETMRANAERDRIAALYAERDAQWAAYTSALRQLEAEEVQRLAGVTLPVAGLAVHDGHVTIDHGAGPVRIASDNAAANALLDVAIAAAIGHRLVALRNAALIVNDEVWAQIFELCTKHGLQPFIEEPVKGELLHAVIEEGE